VPLGEGRAAQAERVEGAGVEVLDQHVRAGDQAVEDRAAAGFP